MAVIVAQSFGIGDVIFSMSAILKAYPDQKIIWPVLSGYVDGLQRAYPAIQFVDSAEYAQELNMKGFGVFNGNTIVPLRWSYEILKVPFTMCMKSKYMLFEQDWKTWKEQAMWQRDRIREQTLFELLGLSDAPYYVINNTFGCDFKGKVAIKTINPDMRRVIMSTIPGFSLFDWAMVLQNATEIYTVSTSIIYILEMLKLNAKEVHIYIRRPNESNHKNYDYILTSHNYILHP